MFDFYAQNMVMWYSNDDYQGPKLPRCFCLWQFEPGHAVMIERFRED